MLAMAALLPICASADEGMRTGFTHWHFRVEAPAEQEEALQALAKAGVAYIHGEIAWGQTEVAPGTFDFSRYDAAFSLLRRYGIRVYLTLGAGVDGEVSAMPDFYFSRGGVLTRVPAGVRWACDAASGALRPHEREPGAGYQAVFSDLEFQTREEQWMRAALGWLKQNWRDVVVACGPNNEPFGIMGPLDIDYSEENRRAFADWLRERYGTVRALNAAWSTEGRVYTYEDFARVELPRRPVESATLNPRVFRAHRTSPAAWVDFAAFMRQEYIFRYLDSRLRIIKEEMPDVRTFVKLPAQVPSGWCLADQVAHRLAASAHLDVLGLDVYTADLDDLGQALCSIAATAQRYGKEWGVFEIGVEIPHHADPWVASMLRYLGAWRPECLFAYKLVDAPPQEGYYLLGRGPRQPRFSDVVEALRELSGQQVRPPRPQIAVVWPAAVGFYRGNLTPIRDCQSAVAAVGAHAAVVWDEELRRDRAMLRQFRLVILPYCRVLREKPDDRQLLTALQGFADAGGCVLIETCFDLATVALEPVPLESTNSLLHCLPARLGPTDWRGQAIAPEQAAEWRHLGEEARRGPSTVAGEGQAHFELKPGARVLARYGGTHDAAIVRSRDGRIVLIGPQLAPEWKRALTEALLEDWALLPFRLEGGGLRAQLGPDALSIANPTESPRKFRLVLPRRAELSDLTGIQVEHAADGTTVLRGELPPRSALFRRLQSQR